MATYRVAPNDSEGAIQQRLDRMAANDRLLFTPGNYKPFSVAMRGSDQIIEAEQGAYLHGLGCKFNVYGQRNVFNKLVFKEGGTIDVKTSGRQTHVLNCAWLDAEGYAKRIKLGGGQSAHYVYMAGVVYNCIFDNIQGINNNGAVGGEIVSVKSSGNLVANCRFNNCAGSLSFRAGTHNAAVANTFARITHKRSGISIYDYHNKAVDNDLGGTAWIRMGDGDSKHRNPDAPVADNKHQPASYATVVGNRNGRIQFTHVYKTYNPVDYVLFDNPGCEVLS